MDQPKKGKKNAGFSCLVKKYVAPELAQNDFSMTKAENDYYIFYKNTNAAERIMLSNNNRRKIVTCALRRNPDTGGHIFLISIHRLVRLFGTAEEKEVFRFSNQSIYYTTEEELLGALEFCVDMIQRYSADFYAGVLDELLFATMKQYESWRERQVAEMGEQAFMDQRMEESDLWKKQRFSSKRWSL